MSISTIIAIVAGLLSIISMIALAKATKRAQTAEATVKTLWEASQTNLVRAELAEAELKRHQSVDPMYVAAVLS